MADVVRKGEIVMVIIIMMTLTSIHNKIALKFGFPVIPASFKPIRESYAEIFEMTFAH